MNHVLFLILGLSAIVSTVRGQNVDVLVYGATPGGIAAAISAAKGGSSVLLVEPTTTVGGLMASGLSYSDFRSFESLTGFFLDFSRRVERHYADAYGKTSDQVKASWRGTMGEPSVNVLTFRRMLGEHPRIQVVTNHVLAGVKLGDYSGGRRRILSVSFTGRDGRLLEVQPKVAIDAGYEGDLMAKAGENYHIGRESRAQYGEEMAGDEGGGADGQVQGYNFRFIMTTVETNKLMPVAPPGYRREDFTGALPHFTSGRLKKVFSAGHDGIFRAHTPLIPNRKADVNDTPHAPVRLSMPDINDGYPDGDAATRDRIFAEHLYYNVGLLYFLQNDDAVPAAVRTDARSHGFCRDEFKDTGGVPPLLYIREARRLVGQHVFTGNDTRQTTNEARAVLNTNSIAIGDYVHNCHGTGRIGTRFDGSHTGEFYKPIQPYQIPYGVIVPTRTANLLVPVACSASHFGFGALRLEPIWSSLGQAAGWAAAVAVASDIPVQQVSVPVLQRRLHSDRSSTIYLADVPPDSPDFAAAQWIGTLGGFHGFHSSAQPKPKPLGGQFNEAFPGHNADLGKPAEDGLTAQWKRLVNDATAGRSKHPTDETPRTRREVLQMLYRSSVKP